MLKPSGAYTSVLTGFKDAEKFEVVLGRRQMIISIEVEILGAGDRLRAARIKAGLTQDDLGGEVQRSRQTVIKWEADQYAPVPYELLLELEKLLEAEIIPKGELLRAIAQLLGAEEIHGITFRIVSQD